MYFYMAFFIMNNQTLKEIGFFSRVHGFKGKLVLSIPNELIEFISKNISIWVETTGIKSPYKIIKVQPLKRGKIIVEMLNIDHNKAQLMIKSKVYLDASKIVNKNNPVNEGKFITDYEIYDQDNKLIGNIKDHIKIKNNEIIQTFINDNEVLIPYKKENIIEVNHSKKYVKVIIPEGLLSIYLD